MPQDCNIYNYNDLKRIDIGNTCFGSSDEASSDLQKFMVWVESFLTKASNRLGRKGDVCPWCAPSLKAGQFWVTQLDVSTCSETQQDKHFLQLLEQWFELEKQSPTTNSVRTMITILTGLDDIEHKILSIHRRLKIQFVERGLMFGEFYPHNTTPGIRDIQFRPLDSPVPLLVIRPMLPLDIIFLSQDKNYREAYYKKFTSISNGTLKKIEAVTEPYTITSSYGTA